MSWLTWKTFVLLVFHKQDIAYNNETAHDDKPGEVIIADLCVWDVWLPQAA